MESDKFARIWLMTHSLSPRKTPMIVPGVTGADVTTPDDETYWMQGDATRKDDASCTKSDGIAR